MCIQMDALGGKGLIKVYTTVIFHITFFFIKSLLFLRDIFKKKQFNFIPRYMRCEIFGEFLILEQTYYVKKKKKN